MQVACLEVGVAACQRVRTDGWGRQIGWQQNRVRSKVTAHCLGDLHRGAAPRNRPGGTGPGTKREVVSGYRARPGIVMAGPGRLFLPQFPVR